MDRPNFKDSEQELAQRQEETLVVGDAVQAWRFQEIKGAKEVRGEHRWLDGEVIAVAIAPCDGVDWVAMVQWYKDNTVIAWEAIPSHMWRTWITLRRTPTTTS